jgi:drug/metabolite transporter (DMT)-like permease
MAEKLEAPQKKVTKQGLIHLGIVYLVWSSTYLAIRIAVMDGAGFPPFTLGFMRTILAGSILMLWAWIRKEKIKPNKRDVWIMAVSGILLWNGGNGLVTIAEQRADSGLAALLVAAMPIWVLIIEFILDRKLPSPIIIGSLLVGFAGVAILSYPTLKAGGQADMLALIALLIAPLCWGAGSVLQARNPVSVSPRANAAYQMLFGSIGFLILIFIMKEPLPTPSRDAWLAFFYLVAFGSILTYTSYVTILQILPTKLVMTYSYVNPVLAVVLGWWILNEPISGWTFAGAVLVLLGVAGVFRERTKKIPSLMTGDK